VQGADHVAVGVDLDQEGAPPLVEHEVGREEDDALVPQPGLLDLVVDVQQLLAREEHHLDQRPLHVSPRNLLPEAPPRRLHVVVPVVVCGRGGVEALLRGEHVAHPVRVLAAVVAVARAREEVVDARVLDVLRAAVVLPHRHLRDAGAVINNYYLIN